MASPNNLRYTTDHIWILVNGKEATLGITDPAQKQLGEIVYVELPKVGDTVNANDAFGSVESVKAVSELFTPVGGMVIAINEELSDSPETLNDDAYGAWLIKVSPVNENDMKELMTADGYDKFCKSEIE